MEGEGEQIEGDQQSGKVLLAVAGVVLEVVAIGFENVEGLVLNLPSGSACGCGCRRGSGSARTGSHSLIARDPLGVGVDAPGRTGFA